MTIRETLKRAGWQRTPGTKNNWLLSLKTVVLVVHRSGSGRCYGYVLTDGPGRDYPTLAAAAEAARAAGVQFLLREAEETKARATAILEDSAKLRGEIAKRPTKRRSIR